LKNGTWKIIGSALISAAVVFLAMWLTLGANAASKMELAASEARLNSKLEALSDLVAETTASTNQILGYIQAKDGANLKEKK
jgi:hypothetical protein